ncbi:glycosyltransferase family 4 protein [Tardiphaga alba]|uniref:Glycosyltransferase family 4 protein n=1 Tax=Tardiphaga alba TaxID=340268 RepID=A0ABX8AG91_9BRAD|nr:glycosyltransferase [Tardiphaga alba]QUS41340.1 glycosyltransferase family 4 protein [Tardiphaga alba]
MSSARPLKILSIAHPAVSRDAGRLRYYPLAGRADVTVDLVVPALWYQFGRTIVADPSDDPGMTVHVMPIRLPRAGPMSWYLHFYPGLRRLIRDIDPDVVHLWEEPWSVVALQARFLKGRAAMVMEVDQNILKRLPPPFEFIREQVLAHTDHVLSRSPDATDVVRARGYSGPVSSIGYGVDLSTFNPDVTPLLPPPMRPEFRIGYVGRLVVEKGLDDALDAMARTKIPVSLALMGEGPHEERLRQHVAELGLGARVSFQGWGKPADVASFLRSLDALVLLTRTTKSVREQFGRVITEAQACGVPVIGSQGGAIPDVVGDGGWIVPESDPAALAQLLDEIATDPNALHARGRAAQENVMRRFTYEAVANDLVAACHAAARRRRAAM